MRLGVREFRERISEVVNGREPVVVTSNGKPAGQYVPEHMLLSGDEIDSWLDKALKFGTEWEENTPDWYDRLLRMDWDERGDPLDQPPRY